MLTLPELMRVNGHVAHLINDTLHLVNYGFGFDRPFHSWWMIRGNEVDRFNSDYGEFPLECDPGKMSPGVRDTFHAQYLRNIRNRENEEDYFAPQVMTAAMDWLTRNHKHENFFLWVDCFDPHEPWDPPQRYIDMYNPDYEGDPVATNFFNVSTTSERELQHIRACYAGEVTMADTWLGKLLNYVEELGIEDETAVVIMSDHGTGLGDHGNIQKSSPLYEEVARIVWMMRIPGVSRPGARTRAFVQPCDLMPTILEVAGIPCPEEVQGSSLVPTLRDESEVNRDFAASGGALIGSARPITITQGDWSMIHSTSRDQWELYNLREDPGQLENVVNENQAQAERMHETVMQFLSWTGAPEWALKAYRGEKLAPQLSKEAQDYATRMLNVRNFMVCPCA